METLKEIVTVVNDLSPIGLAGMLAYIIYQLVHKKGAIRSISENHLSGLPELHTQITQLTEMARRQTDLLLAIRDSSQRLETTLARLEGALGRAECPFKRD